MAITQYTKVLTFSEAAEYLRITPPTLRNYIKLNAIPYRRVKRRIFFSLDALNKWLEGNSPQHTGQ